MWVHTPGSIEEIVQRKAEERSARIAAVLRPFRERPGALTFYEAEKAVHALTRKLATCAGKSQA
jgi:hypothetical protein